jgi:hypothetical protein
MEGSVCFPSRSLAIRTGNHSYILTAARAIATAVAFADRTAHTNADLLSDQHQNPAQAAAMHPIMCIRSHSMMLIKREQRLTKPHIPANAVRKMHTRMPITFIKVFDTMFSIL